MAQYIDKDALVAEIEKELNTTRKYSTEYVNGKKYALKKILSILDHLEVKEVDLEREMQAFAKLYLEPLKVYDANVGISITMHQLYLCAKHFFELGLKGNIDKMTQEEPAPPGIREESEKKGWLDYGLMIGEIGLHRYNAIRRIKEHKEQFNSLAIPDLYHVSEYYESVGIEKVCCCLQAYSKDFVFTQDEVKEIIEKEMEETKKIVHIVDEDTGNLYEVEVDKNKAQKGE